MSSRFQLSLASGERGGWGAAAAAVGRLACSAESLVAELSQRRVFVEWAAWHTCM